MSYRTRSIAALRLAGVAYPSSEYARKDGPENLRCPAQFCEFRSETLNNLIFKPHVQTKGRLAFCFERVMATFVFFRISLSVISLDKKK